MRLTILSILLMMAHECWGQSFSVIDTTYIKCSYEFTGVGVRNDLLYLQIGSKYSKSYSFYTNRKDSILSTPNGRKVWGKMLSLALEKMNGSMDFPSDYPEARSAVFVHKNYPLGKMTVTDQIVADYYIYEERLDLQKWEIPEDSTRIIMGHECQQATCRFRGREWTAWFALDIPISDGPWKLCGLPGLIMEAYDKGYQRHFLITGLQEEIEPIFVGRHGKSLKIFEKTEHDAFLKRQYDELRNRTSYNIAVQEIGIPTSTDNKIPHYEYLEREEE